MRRFHLKRGTTYCPGVNIDRLWSLIPSEVYEKAKAAPSDKAPVLDVTKLVSSVMCKMLRGSH
jgi:large subunit ribosomal protein L27Ae